MHLECPLFDSTNQYGRILCSKKKVKGERSLISCFEINASAQEGVEMVLQMDDAKGNRERVSFASGRDEEYIYRATEVK